MTINSLKCLTHCKKKVSDGYKLHRCFECVEDSFRRQRTISVLSSSCSFQFFTYFILRHANYANTSRCTRYVSSRCFPMAEDSVQFSAIGALIRSSFPSNDCGYCAPAFCLWLTVLFIWKTCSGFLAFSHDSPVSQVPEESTKLPPNPFPPSLRGLLDHTFQLVRWPPAPLALAKH